MNPFPGEERTTDRHSCDDTNSKRSTASVPLLATKPEETHEPGHYNNTPAATINLSPEIFTVSTEKFALTP